MWAEGLEEHTVAHLEDQVAFLERIMSVAWPPYRSRNSPNIKAGRLLPLRGVANKAERRPSHLRQSELLAKLHDSILIKRPPPATACLTLRSGTIRADPML